MSSQLSSLPRHTLTPRQAQLVERLLVAGALELEDVGHEELTIRSVAVRAGVSPATAYTYLASKDHLFAELFCRLLIREGTVVLTASAPEDRLQQTLRHLSVVLAGSPATTAAATRSLLGADPQVHRLRLTIGAIFLELFHLALGGAGDDPALHAVSLTFFGALLEAGMGFLPYAELGDRLAPVMAVIMKGRV